MVVGRETPARRSPAGWPRLQLAFFLVLGFVPALGSCGDDDGGDAGGSDASTVDAAGRTALLESVVERVILPALRDFADQAEALRDATENYASATAVESGPASGELATARDAFVVAMGTWQRLEVLQVGPAGAADMVMGGAGLRDEIYSWPTSSACRVDQEVVAGEFDGADFFDGTLVNGYGLDALEYLLHVETDDNDCPGTLAINTEGQWAALSADDVRTRRAAYAAVVASNVATRARELRAAWLSDGGNFAADFTSGSGTYGTAQEALDALFAAMFYIDLELKDQKLADPAGISTTCTTDICPDERESLWANRSRQYIAANLRAMDALVVGGDADDEDAYGFADLLREMGAGELADELETEISAAIAAVEAIDGSLADALSDDLASVEAAHAAVKRVTDLLKSQFVTVLNLRVPQEGAGDND